MPSTPRPKSSRAHVGRSPHSPLTARTRGLSFEHLEDRLVLSADFGDAPLPYPTTLSQDGARHEAVGPLLGAARDAEADGQPTATADGDGVDDDGVEFASLRVGQRGATASITVSHAPSGAFVDAWIDFNGDGVWGGPDEQIAASVAVVSGTNVLTFDVPGAVADGLKFARVRLSTAGGLGPGGAAADGEVEDLVVPIGPAARASGEFSSVNFYSTPSDRAMDEPVLVDVDRDGDLDFVASVRQEGFKDEFAWYEFAAGSYVKHVIVPDLQGAPRDLVPVDLDRDGDLDIVVASGLGFSWYENDGSQNFTARQVEVGIYNTRAVAPADVDGDGDLDLFATIEIFLFSGTTVNVVWYENDGAEQFTRRPVSPPGYFNGQSLNPVDIDGDGDLDLVTFQEASALPAVFENDGSQNFTRRLHTGVLTDVEIADLTVVDLDKDGDADILAAEKGNGSQPRAIVWYENTGALAFTRREIAANYYATPVSLRAADIDGDGDVDLIVGAFNVAVLENDGGQNFTVRQFPSSFGLRADLQILDFNDDGDLDIFGYGNFGELYINDQIDNRVSVAASAPSVVEDGGEAIDFTLTRGGHLSAALAVNFTVSGVAAYLGDYTQSGAAAFGPTSGTVTFAPGEATAVVRVTPIADVVRELDESILITIDPGVGYVLGSTAEASTLIIDDDLADFGDAPAPYPTTLAANGARHVASGPRLGAQRDQELDAAPSTAADGDDLADADDEDGVTWGVLRVGAASATATVDVQNAPAGARIDAWIDFDGDGSWSGSGERIAASLSVVEGLNSITFAVPADARSGPTVARFRISTAGGLAPTGIGADGEVEDLVVTIDPPKAGRHFGAENTIPSVASSQLAITPSDLDRDGDVDVVAASGRGVYWYESNGAGAFTERLIAALDRNPSDLKVADLDGDGDLDVAVVCAEFPSGRVAWLENDGSQSFTLHVLGTFPNYVYAVEAADLDGDGDLDLAVAGAFSDGNRWYENVGGEFTPHVLGASHLAGRTIDAGDIDGDGDMDLVADGGTGLVWLENVGRAFTEHTVATTATAIYTTQTVDLDRDGDADFVLLVDGESRMIWLENDGTQAFSQHEIANAAAGVLRNGSVVDVDGDGDWDIVAAASSGGAVWYENDGDQNFARRALSTAVNVSDVAAADIDGDGDLDFVERLAVSPRLAWVKNVDQWTTVSVTTTTSVEDAAASLVVTFVREGDLSAPLTLSFAVGGTAMFNVDYQQAGAETFSTTQGTVAFVAGQTTAQVTLTPLADAMPEMHETIIITARRGADFGVDPPEQVTLTILDDEPIDFGDAPAPFKTLRADGGAGHVAVGPTLGPTRDADADGVPSPGADGDDLAGADEDGVSFGPIRVGQLRAEALVRVAGAPDGARLDAWMDFDGDGSWSGADEKIAHALPVANGDNIIRFDVPATARPGAAYVRFRLSTAGGLTPTGFALDGEVEDYFATVAPPAVANFAFLFGVTIPSAGGGEPIDVDRDGDLDFFASRSGLSQVAPFINVADQFTPQGGVGLPYGSLVVPVDFDRDGDVDLVAGRPGFANALQWFERTATTWVARTISATNQTVTRPTVIDMDGDGDLDVVAATSAEGVSWYEHRPGQPFLRHAIGTPGSNADVDAGDFDGDGDVDVLVSHSSVVLYENAGGQFTARILLTSVGARQIQAADLDGDGDQDAVFALTGSGTLAWLEQTSPRVFVQRAIAAPAASYATLQPVDLDGDGDLDILAASSVGTVAFENTEGVFTRRVLSPAGNVQARAGDFDQDGDLDILVADGASFFNSYWLENIAATDGDTDDDADVDGLDFLAWQRALGSAVPRGQGPDGNGDGRIDAADLAVWKATFGVQPPTPPVVTAAAAAASEAIEEGGATPAAIAASGSVRDAADACAIASRMGEQTTRPSPPRECVPPKPESTASVNWNPSPIRVAVHVSKALAALEIPHPGVGAESSGIAAVSSPRALDAALARLFPPQL